MDNTKRWVVRALSRKQGAIGTFGVLKDFAVEAQSRDAAITAGIAAAHDAGYETRGVIATQMEADGTFAFDPNDLVKILREHTGESMGSKFEKALGRG